LKPGKKEILHLRTADNPDELTGEERKAAIEWNKRILFFITWTKKGSYNKRICSKNLHFFQRSTKIFSSDKNHSI